MLRQLQIVVDRLAGDTLGSEIAEAAAVLPIMFMFVIGIFWFGQAFSIYGTITRAAQEGARAAVAPQCTTCSSSDPSTNAFNTIQSVMTTAHLDPTQMTQLSTAPSLTSCAAGGGAATCDTSQSKICVQGVQHTGGGQLQETFVQLSSTTNPPGVCGVSVSFRYPFSFWLPFTALNKQQIWLQAQAEVRAESQ